MRMTIRRWCIAYLIRLPSNWLRRRKCESLSRDLRFSMRSVGPFGTGHRYAFQTSFVIDDGATSIETIVGGTMFYGYSRSALTDVRILFGRAEFGVDDIMATTVEGVAVSIARSSAAHRAT